MYKKIGGKLNIPIDWNCLFIVFWIDYIIPSQRLVNAYQGTNVDEAILVLSTLFRQNYN